jgi:hypothetical protein
VKFDMTNRGVRWCLYVYNNHRHDGEIWFAYKSPYGVMLTTELRENDLLGEARTRFIDGKFVHDIVPFRLRTRRELEVLARQTEAHKAYRAQLYARYPIEERVKDLSVGDVHGKKGRSGPQGKGSGGIQSPFV